LSLRDAAFIEAAFARQYAMVGRGGFVKTLAFLSLSAFVAAACGDDATATDGNETPAAGRGAGNAAGKAGSGGTSGKAGQSGTSAGQSGASGGQSGAGGAFGGVGGVSSGAGGGGTAGTSPGGSGGLGGSASGGLGGNPSGGAGGSAGTIGGAGTGGAAGSSSCNRRCSPDLRQVFDCDDVLVQTCAANEACGKEFSCVPACVEAQQRETTNGCDFFAAHPPTYRGELGGTRGGCFVAMLANTWTTPVGVSIGVGNGATIDGAPFTRLPKGSGKTLTYEPLVDGKIPPGQLGLVFLNDYESGQDGRIACPVPAAFHEQADLLGTARGKAFHVVTDVPVVAYDIFPWGGAKSFVAGSTQLVPTPTWGSNFVTLDAWEAYSQATAANNNLPFTQIVGSVDDTQVRIVPAAAIEGGPGIDGAAAKAVVSYTIGRGELLQLSQKERLAGSILVSDKPVGLWGGSGCALIPTGQAACDSIHQEQLPIRKLGFEYVGARFPNRTDKEPLTPYTVVGMVDGTVLSYDDKPNGAPLTLVAGQVARFFTDKQFTVRSQDLDHPFSLTGYMTGCASVTSKEACDYATGDAHGGDPEMMAMIPPAQYLDSYLFVADPTYSNTALVFVRKKAFGGSFDDVTLDCAGVIGGWTPVGTEGRYEVAKVYLNKDGADVGACSTGSHTATSKTPFGLSVWGWDVAVSYGFPAGFSTRNLNQVYVGPKD
jgi:hypothetical protein